MKQTFKTELIKSGDSEATGIKLPFDIEEVWGAKRVKVKAWINGAEYRGSAVRMGGEYWMGVPKAFRDAAGIKGGERIEVTMERDDEERVIAPPGDLAAAIDKAGVRAAWESMSYSKQKSNALAVSETKGAELREKKIGKIVLMLQAMDIQAKLAGKGS
jgi:bifunctional DNA-binding transcriptional regulator/antitoxin component of YhaV-PrlF toxin-antitoxin module